MICGRNLMDREKMRQQAKVLREKKLARIAQVAKQLRPHVEKGVVKYNEPSSYKPKEVRSFVIPPSPQRIRSVMPMAQQSPQQQEMQQQQINPQKIVRRQPGGCSGCKRKIGGK